MKEAARNNKWMKWGKGAAAGMLLLGLLHTSETASAAGTETGNIRVAMFLDLGSTYKSTTPAITLQPSSELSAGPGNSGGSKDWVQVRANEQARFSIDGFRVKALQTSDWTTATAAVKKLQGTADKPILFAEDAGGKEVYQLYTGMYATAAAAEKAEASVSSALGSLLGGQKPQARGALYLSAGVFSSAYDADALRSQITAAGVDAWVALTAGQGAAPAYSVWIGEAEDAATLAAAKGAALAKLPSLQLSPVDAVAPAVIVRSDATNDLTTPTPLAHYMFSGSGNTFWLEPAPGGLTKLAERSNRKYRGGFEISQVNGQLALVNELPLEQYLYSVVGAEVPSSWNAEALKAQAVAARSYALYQSPTKFKIAGVVDTTLSQVYLGVGTEADSVTQAVDSTAGEVMMSGGRIVEGIFSSNTGGTTADSTEVWGNADPVYASVSSPEDQSAQAGLKQWYHVVLSSGTTGYIREDNTKLTGESTAAGLSYLTVTAANTNVRPLPMVDSTVDPVAKLNPGDQAVVLEKVDESSAYSWVRGPFTSDQLVKSLQGKTSGSVSSPIASLIVSQRGPSGRATQVKVNGQILKVSYPDSYRSVFGSLPSTLFDIVQTGRYTVLGAGSQTGTGTAAAGTAVLSASGKTSMTGGNLVVMNGSGEARAVDQSNRFLFVGQGNGHGLGLSQWGAKGMADEGYDYQAILQHYYQNVTITKD